MLRLSCTDDVCSSEEWRQWSREVEKCLNSRSKEREREMAVAISADRGVRRHGERCCNLYCVDGEGVGWGGWRKKCRF